MILRRGVLFLFVVLFSATNVFYAQSDYEKVEAFKKEVSEIKQKISGAQSLAECESLTETINSLRDKYAVEKDLLDKSLYPGDFESTIAKLESDLKVRSADFSVITDLTEEVSSMKVVIQDLTKQNETLIERITVLSEKTKKDAAEISNLQKLVAQLKKNINKRDLLVRSMIDSLLTEFVRSPTTLNEAEKQTVIGELENKSLFYNIERVIADNVSYIEVTEMKVPDFSEMFNEYKTFSKSWRQLGEKLAEVYLDKNERPKELAYINNLFSDWNNMLHTKVWKNINKEFAEKEIKLLPFSDGDEFTSSLLTFIANEKENIPLMNEDELKKTHDKFMYGVYLKSVQPEWIPFLINNKLMTDAQKDTVQAHMVTWKEALYPEPDLTWLYILIGVIVLIQAVVYFSRRRGESKIGWKKTKEE